MRWRIEKEVIEGKGQFICGDKKCTIKDGKYFAPNGEESLLYKNLRENMSEDEANDLFVLSKTPSFQENVVTPLIEEYRITKGASEWEGWGTALKPAHEPIVLARKPFHGTVAANVQQHGTGALNIDGCRVGMSEDDKQQSANNWKPQGYELKNSLYEFGTKTVATEQPAGRWPANLAHDGSPAVLDLFPRDAARFFYSAKASKADRGEGNTHPTVKPSDLMGYVCRLVTPPGGLILDPFMGSGSTGVGALREGFRFAGIELDASYLEIARARLGAA
jgi:site-specific DNA-methyltransferase (adenine-specific)